MRAVIYIRQSLDRNDDHLAVERQLAECQRLCDQRGYDVSKVITDNNFSASKHGRPGYDELLQLMRSHVVDFVVILRIDRLMRLNDELEDLIKIVESHPVSVATAEGDIDLGSPGGRLVARILVSVARSEMEVKSARHKLANSQKAAAGKPHGSSRPYGYQADMITICEPEAAVMREMARRTIAGHSYKEVAYWANGRGYRTTTGKVFQPVNIRNLLLKKRYAGIREHYGAEYPAVWDAVFDRVTWERLQLTLRLRHERAGVRGNQGAPLARKYLLTGLLTCGKCGWPLSGSRMYDRPGYKSRPVYICNKRTDKLEPSGCSGIRRNADALDDFITECVMYRLDSPALGKLLTETQGDDPAIQQHLSERHLLTDRLHNLVDDYATGLLDRAQFARAKTAAETQLEHVERLLEASTRARTAVTLLPAGMTVRKAWEKSESNEWRRQLLRLLVDGVVVNTGIKKPWYRLRDGTMARFDPNLIKIRWRA